jgi:glycosyltransferase involved in cell wall biosynthesis
LFDRREVTTDGTVDVIRQSQPSLVAMKQKTAVISINAAWNIYNFRRGLIAGLHAAGFRVVALAPRDEYIERLSDLGIEFWPIEIDKQGVSPSRDLMLLGRYYRVLRSIRPDIFLGYTAKPNIYGSIAAHLLGIPVINNVAGLGTAFIKQGWLTRIVSSLYRLAFSRSATVFFQNDEDKALFERQGIVSAEKTGLLPGSGINVSEFVPTSLEAADGNLRFLMIARLLWDKGVREYVEAARKLRRQQVSAQFQLLGFLDVPNRTAVGRRDVEAWTSEGVIDYLGHSDDVRPFIAAADCIVLPSYREGLPRVLLEGAAMGKPLIASDVPGCRHVVQHGQNGLLCEVRNSASLAEMMLQMITMERKDRSSMGVVGRKIVEQQFDEKIPVQRYLEAIGAALAGR